MIVWLASFPRSGNTFLRVVLHHLFGVPTYSIYDDDDPVAQRIGPELVGYRPKPPDRQFMLASPELYFTKTHKRRKNDTHAAIYQVRDGRDAIVSLAHFNRTRDIQELHKEPKDWETYLREAILRPFDPKMPSSGSWGGHVLNWYTPDQRMCAVSKYENLIADPVECVLQITAQLQLNITPCNEVEIPSFEELNKRDSDFFRKGLVGCYRDEMPTHLQSLFWSQEENAKAMQLLGYE